MNFQVNKQHGLTLLCAIAALSLFTGCTAKPGEGGATQSYKGIISLDGIKFGLPEESAKTAILSFVADPNVNLAGFTQYLSRTYDANGGQYALAYKDTLPKQLRVLYPKKPITKAEALAKVTALLPATANPESKVDDSEVKAGKKDAPVETHWYGDNLKAELIYTGKDATAVKVVSIVSVATKASEAAKEAITKSAEAKDDKKAE